MEITVRRFYSDEDATLSEILINGKFQCFGLEDEYREHKLAKETRIPSGTYKVGVRAVGGFHSRYAKKFSFHKGMLQVMDVPGFEYILIHIGNTEQNTDGCLLVGSGCIGEDTPTIQYSKKAYTALYHKTIDAAMNDELTINYVDDDR